MSLIFVVPARNNKNADADMARQKIRKICNYFAAKGSVTRTDFETRTDLMEDIIGISSLPRNVAPFGKSDLPRWYSIIRDIDLSPV